MMIFKITDYWKHNRPYMKTKAMNINSHKTSN